MSGVDLSDLADGWLNTAVRLDSPNFDTRPVGCAISLIVVHAISLPPGEFGGDDVSRLFTNCLRPDDHPYFEQISCFRVSAHFLIRRDGSVIQYVSCERRAWHAGVSCWKGRERCNDYSIGIELEGCDEIPFESVQYRQLAALIVLLRGCYPIEDVVGHSDVSPGRKTDPGPCFDWQELDRLVSAIPER